MGCPKFVGAVAVTLPLSFPLPGTTLVGLFWLMVGCWSCQGSSSDVDVNEDATTSPPTATTQQEQPQPSTSSGGTSNRRGQVTPTRNGQLFSNIAPSTSSYSYHKLDNNRQINRGVGEKNFSTSTHPNQIFYDEDDDDEDDEFFNGEKQALLSSVKCDHFNHKGDEGTVPISDNNKQDDIQKFPSSSISGPGSSNPNSTILTFPEDEEDDDLNLNMSFEKWSESDNNNSFTNIRGMSERMMKRLPSLLGRKFWKKSF